MEIETKITEIKLKLNDLELEELQKDLNYVVFMREVRLSKTGKHIYNLLKKPNELYE